MKKFKLKASTTFDKKAAKGMMRTSYYESQLKDKKILAFLEMEKYRLRTIPQKEVSDVFKKWRELGKRNTAEFVPSTLLGLYKKNKNSIISGQKVINSNLLWIVSHPKMLLHAYREIRGNKGALTKAANKDPEDIKKMNADQWKIYCKSNIFPDGFNLEDVWLISKLIRQGKYPWGSSRRIYIPKPGVKDKMRPITIPPFLDRVVQKAIELVLQSIYEPVFEKLNCSFGFRPNLGYHDAIAAVQSGRCSGIITALEGDIEAAYDTVDKDVLVNILAKRIRDKLFLDLIRQRLQYDYVEKGPDPGTSNRVKPKLGIPQGGIDSPYLFNIYINELDEFIKTKVQRYIDALNSKINARKFNPSYSRLVDRMQSPSEQHVPSQTETKKRGSWQSQCQKATRAH